MLFVYVYSQYYRRMCYSKLIGGFVKCRIRVRFSDLVMFRFSCVSLVDNYY